MCYGTCASVGYGAHVLVWTMGHMCQCGLWGTCASVGYGAHVLVWAMGHMC